MSSTPNVSMASNYAQRPTLAQRFTSRRSKAFLFTIMIPNILSIGYFGFIAKPTYVAHSTLLISNPAKDAATMSSLMSGTAGSSNAGAYVLKEFVHSTPEFKNINNRYNLADVYNYDSALDYLRGYGGVTTYFQKNDFALKNYYKSHFKVDIDDDSGLVKMQILAPTEQLAQNMSIQVLADARKHIDAMNNDEQKDFISAATNNVNKTKDALKQDEIELSKFRSDSGIYDPKTFYSSLMTGLEELQVKNVTLQGQYASIIKDTPNNPVASQYLTQMDVFKKAIASSGALVNNQNTNFSNYDALVIRQKSDSSLLKEAEASLQKAEIQDSQNHYYLKVIEQSETLNTPERPYSFMIVGIIFLLSLVSYKIFK